MSETHMNRFFQSTTATSAVCVKPDKISLNDCLACSGCITQTESLEFKVDSSFLNNTDPIYSFIISPQAKKNISSKYPEIDYHVFERCLIEFLKNHFKIHLIVDTSYFKKSSKELISSECPAVVLYVERIFPDLLPFLSTSKTFQQIASEYIRNKSDNLNLINHKVVSIMQCYDKKDELKRDNTKIDYFIGTVDFYEFLKDKFYPKNESEYNLLDHEVTYKNPTEEISGLENCINILNRMKNNKNCAVNNDQTQELRICKNGCINGPAQINDTNLPLEDIYMIYKNQAIEYKTQPRIFNKMKKKTFDISW